jgi:hypothetical protein
MVLEGNPCHEEALEVARMAGWILSSMSRLTEISMQPASFAGDMETAHLAACERVREEMVVPLTRRYDIVITMADTWGLTIIRPSKQYAVPCRHLKNRPKLIIIAETMPPIRSGREEYRILLRFFKEHGAERYLRTLRSRAWVFTKDQWGPQMWGRY